MSLLCNYGVLGKNGKVAKALVPGSVVKYRGFDYDGDESKTFVIKSLQQSVSGGDEYDDSNYWYENYLHFDPTIIDSNYGIFGWDTHDVSDTLSLYPVNYIPISNIEITDLSYNNPKETHLNCYVFEGVTSLSELKPFNDEHAEEQYKFVKTGSLDLFKIAEESMWLPDSGLITTLHGLPMFDDWDSELSTFIGDTRLDIFDNDINVYLKDLYNAFSLVDSNTLFKTLFSKNGNSNLHFVVASFTIDVTNNVVYKNGFKAIPTKLPFFIVFSNLHISKGLQEFKTALLVFPVNDIAVYCTMDRLWYDVLPNLLDGMSDFYYNQSIEEFKVNIKRNDNISILSKYDYRRCFTDKEKVVACKVIDPNMDELVYFPFACGREFKTFLYQDCEIHGVPFKTAIKYMKEAKKLGW